MRATLKHPISLSSDQQILVGWILLAVFAVWQFNGIYLSAMGQGSALFFWMLDGVQWIVLPVALIALLAHKGALYPEHYGLASPGKNLWPLALQGLLIFVIAGLVFIVVRNLSWRVLGPSPGNFQLAQFFLQGVAGTALQIYAAVSAGLVESIFFIGLPWLWYANARSKPSKLHFMLIASAIFALAHWEHGRHIMIAAFCLHLVLCKWFFQWNTLWPVVLGHTLIGLALMV
ncbi:MAG: CPBP family intramembrane metalloprotease [Gammaproteobacteria bacterium]|jgi:hypothetical protein|nr:CPBP family intramembrane metalloprotease [Gammaproteobacteria bacterium]MBU1508227.1 CPBP family intramembrane metalloprotease [Gammaproteobacteria bacterium]MBU2120790.1 CPBP family intramembrane metalloprotease [Gammaproteobacteria bacterium]MBU2173436.1 CPBP family intramembrane metalloprotease [Gammaproteobacteria bacterium]MBU2200547.1 CPBP family intramembrane metalloprotease [Gammaproteobacteria bacterium]